MKRNTLLLLGIIIASIISTQALANTTPSEEDKKAETEKFIKKIKAIPEYSMFVKAFEKTDLSKKLALLDEYTLLIPSNKAFQLLPEDVYENFLKEEYLTDLELVLSYHIIPKKLDEKDLNNYESLETIEGSTLNVQLGESIGVENAHLIEKTIKSRNSVVYTIDKLILPL